MDSVRTDLRSQSNSRIFVAYLSGAFGEIRSQTADNFCIGQLLLERLQNQYCLRTEKALKSLEFQRIDRMIKFQGDRNDLFFYYFLISQKAKIRIAIGAIVEIG